MPTGLTVALTAEFLRLVLYAVGCVNTFTMSLFGPTQRKDQQATELEMLPSLRTCIADAFASNVDTPKRKLRELGRVMTFRAVKDPLTTRMTVNDLSRMTINIVYVSRNADGSFGVFNLAHGAAVTVPRNLVVDNAHSRFVMFM